MAPQLIDTEQMIPGSGEFLKSYTFRYDLVVINVTNLTNATNSVSQPAWGLSISSGDADVPVDGDSFGSAIRTTFNAAPVVSTCNLVQKAQNVTLPQGNLSDDWSTSIGSSFHITLDQCNLDPTYTNYAVIIALQPRNGSWSASNGVLNVTGSATGVAIQILRDGAAFPLESMQSVGRSSPAGMLDVTMYARYYKTDPQHLNPGSVSAVVDVILAYQ
jgi:type 1 fimbria pilin